jgi:iron-sulfur cluster assembly accessory protein
METAVNAPIQFSPSAVAELNRLMNDPGFDNTNHLRIGVKGGGCSGLSYVLGFDKKTEKDAEYEAEGIHFIMERAHELYLSGMVIDWENGLNNRGFTFNNPNASSTCGCGSSFGV